MDDVGDLLAETSHDIRMADKEPAILCESSFPGSLLGVPTTSMINSKPLYPGLPEAR